MARRPRVLTSNVANTYAGPDERIIEFASEAGGGLIAFRTRPRRGVEPYDTPQVLDVAVYRADPGVRVSVHYDEQPDTEVVTHATAVPGATGPSADTEGYDRNTREEDTAEAALLRARATRTATDTEEPPAELAAHLAACGLDPMAAAAALLGEVHALRARLAAYENGEARAWVLYDGENFAEDPDLDGRAGGWPTPICVMVGTAEDAQREADERNLERLAADGELAADRVVRVFAAPSRGTEGLPIIWGR